MSSLTLPKSGGLVNGELLERPMLALLTVENASSSLPTPTARDHKDTTVEIKKHRPEATDSINSALAHLLPTPAVNDMGSGKDPDAWNEWAAKQKSADGRPAPHGKSLEQEALTMLPTPTTRSDATHRKDFAPSLYQEVIVLPTPKATNNENQQNLTGYGPNLGMALMPDQYDWSKTGKMLPTPKARDYKDESLPPRITKKNWQGGAQLPREIAMLPTLRAQEPASTTVGYGKSVLEAVTGQEQNGESTPQQSDDGSLF
jgi:hypothetical protein